MNVGFIGVGNMGKHMAHYILKAGNDLYVHDIRREAAESLLEEGARWMDTPAEIAKVCNVVLTSLPGPPEVEAVVFGENGLASGWKKGDIYIDTSTNSPIVIRRIAGEAGKVGVEVLDAPVTGGTPAAEAGQVNFLVGGSAAALEKVRGILEATSSKIFYLGENGCGDIAKLVNNITAFSTLAVDAEAFTLGVKAGIDPAVLLDLVKVSVGNNKSLGLYELSIAGEGFFEPIFRLSLAAKDSDLALGLGEQLGVPLPIARAVRERLSVAEAAGYSEKGLQTIMLDLEEKAGVKVRIPKK